MAHEDLINRMIAAYRDLNLLIRPLPDDAMTRRAGGEASVRDTVERLRDNELRFTQATKDILTGQRVPDEYDDATPTLGMEHEGDPARVLLSQFGTARESTLAMLREMSEQQWAATDGKGRTMLVRVEALVENDRKVLAHVQSLMGAAPAGVPA